MKKSITQESQNGCGIACFAFVTSLSYKGAEKFLGPKQAKSNKFIIKDFVAQLNRFGKPYTAKHIKPGNRIAHQEGAIVLIRRSKRYPVGHYLVSHQGQWMDPWINQLRDQAVNHARSGYRKGLPGEAMYVIVPTG